ncbi:MAG TPA: phosphoribosyltransferase family protein [Candidatus Babeliaceae bacterium]|nr:phosphoribosyltransferase family protein [Candidatus Babeliaceae bacterium]
MTISTEISVFIYIDFLVSMGLQLSKIRYRPKRYVEHYYLCNYRPLHTGGDQLSQSLLRFKSAIQDDLRAWIDCSVSELKQLAIPRDVIVMRALGSHETAVESRTDTALDRLGKSIAKAFGIRWMPWLIAKARHTRPLKSLTAKERRAEIKRTYQLTKDYFDFDGKRILLIDDITTTGITLTSIIRLIKQYFPDSRFKVFTLAKTEQESPLNASLHLSGSGYLWENDAGWRAAEPETEYNAYSKLVSCIRGDDFTID